MNTVKALSEFGQSIWFDYIRRDMLVSGELARLLEVDGIRGVTSNPSIFQAAISDGDEYLQDIRDAAAAGLSVIDTYEKLAIADIQQACDILRPVFDATDGSDGYVSMEVSPYLARKTEATIEEARRLFSRIQRPNVMIKVPATLEGLPAIQTLIADGININVTLLFSVEMYRKVMEAYLSGLEMRAETSDLSKGSVSVASFFVSRVDTLADELLEKQITLQKDDKRKQEMQSYIGTSAVANARLAYETYVAVFNTDRYKKLAALGARKQRILWASTSTKNPDFPDIKYVQDLIALDSVNTVPPAALDAFRDHGVVENALAVPAADAAILEKFEQFGVPIEQVTAQLLDEGVDKFSKAFDQLLAAIQKKMKG
jgi:transaldolase/glucose-6-phosphate isomerase